MQTRKVNNENRKKLAKVLGSSFEDVLRGESQQELIDTNNGSSTNSNINLKKEKEDSKKKKKEEEKKRKAFVKNLLKGATCK